MLRLRGGWGSSSECEGNSRRLPAAFRRGPQLTFVAGLNSILSRANWASGAFHAGLRPDPRQLDVSRQAQQAQRENTVPVHVDFPPAQPMACRVHVSMVVVVP